MSTITPVTRRDRLRPLDEADLSQILAWRNAPEVRAVMFSTHEISQAEHEAWFARLQDDPSRVALIFEADGVPMGVVNLTSIDTLSGEAHWGFYLRPRAPKGSGTRLGRLALAQAFGALSLNKLVGEVLASNVASLAFHRKLGFEPEGLLSVHHREGETARDVQVFGLTREAWLLACKAHHATLEATTEASPSGETPWT